MHAILSFLTDIAHSTFSVMIKSRYTLLMPQKFALLQVNADIRYFGCKLIVVFISFNGGGFWSEVFLALLDWSLVVHRQYSIGFTICKSMTKESKPRNWPLQPPFIMDDLIRYSEICGRVLDRKELVDSG